MKTLPLYALCICFCASLPAAIVRIDCDPVATATGYNFYFGSNSGRYVLSYSAPKPTLTLDLAADVKWFCVVTAVNAAQACPFWETSDRSDDAPEISFTLTNRGLSLVILATTNPALPRASWTVWTNLPVLPAGTGEMFYALRIDDSRAPATSPQPAPGFSRINILHPPAPMPMKPKR